MRNSDNDKLKNLLKEGAWQAPDNPWFTKRLLNRLPERHASRGKAIWIVVCVAALAGCMAGWRLFSEQVVDDTTTITLFDTLKVDNAVMYYCALLIVTVFIIQQIVSVAIKSRQ